MRLTSFRAALLSPRTYAIILAGTLALGIGPSSRASRAQDDGSQAEVVRREHPELAFARSLAHGYRWYDLAVEVLDNLEKSRPTAEVASQLVSERLEIQMAEVTSPQFKGDAAKRQEIIAKVRKGYEDLVKKGGDTPAAVGAKLKLGEMTLQEGDGAVARMRQTDDPEVRSQARKEAEEKYKAGRSYFEEIREKFVDAVTKAEDEAAKTSSSTTPDDPKVKADIAAANLKLKLAHRRVCTARFHGARALYNLALLEDSASKERQDGLGKCATEFGEINFDYTDEFLGYEAAIFLGLCTKELGRIAESATAFESALGIKDFYDQDDQGHYRLDPEGQDIVSRASYFKAQMLNENKDFDGALKAVKDLFELMPALAKTPLGYAARVEQGRAVGGKGDMKKATEILEKVIEESGKGSYWAQEAKEAMALLGSGGGGLAVAPEKGLNNAKVAIDRGKVAEGLSSLRFLIAQIEQASPEDQKKWLPICWLELGKAYLDLRRYDEAAASFDALVDRTKDKDLSPGALFQQAMAYLQANGAKNNQYDKDAYLETLKKLQKDFPDDDAAKASSFFLGIERFSARDYVQAAKEFEKTAPSAKKLYDSALYQTGLCYVMEGRRLASDKEGKKDEKAAKVVFETAQASLKKAIDWATEGAFATGVPKDGDRAGTLRKMAFDARCRLAEVFGHPLIKDADRALGAAQEAEQGLGTGADPDRVAEARGLAVNAFLLAEKAEKAEQIVESMGKDCPKAVRTSQAERDVGSAFDRLAEAARKASIESARPLYQKAADHLARWLELSLAAEIDITGRDGGRDLSRASDKLYIYAKVLNGIDDEKIQSFSEIEDLTKLKDAKRFLTAASAYREVMKTPAGDWKVGVKLGQCYGFARDFDSAKKTLSSVCQAEKLLIVEKEKDEKGKDVQVTSIDVKVAGANTLLLFAYLDYAYASYFQFFVAGSDRTIIDDVVASAGRLVSVSPAGQETWWRGKYLILAALYEKGEYGDASLGIRQIERQNPKFDDGKYGLKDRFLALKQKLEGKAPPKGGKK